VVNLAGPTDDAVRALAALADALKAPAAPKVFQSAVEMPAVHGALTPALAAAVIGRCLPPGAIVIDEAITCSLFAQQATLASPPHDWLQLMGGSIGDGLPLAVGAAVACRDRKVICLEGDGSAMYTVQSLWTMAREQLDVVNIIFSNRSYAILNIEFERVGVGAPGPRALSMLDMGNPALRWVELANGLGVEAARVDTAEAFERVLRGMLATRGPHLIEVVL